MTTQFYCPGRQPSTSTARARDHQIIKKYLIYHLSRAVIEHNFGAGRRWNGLYVFACFAMKYVHGGYHCGESLIRCRRRIRYLLGTSDPHTLPATTQRRLASRFTNSRDEAKKEGPALVPVYQYMPDLTGNGTEYVRRNRRSVADIVGEQVDSAAGLGAVQQAVLDRRGARRQLHAASNTASAGNAGGRADEVFGVAGGVPVAVGREAEGGLLCGSEAGEAGGQGAKGGKHMHFLQVICG